MNRIAQLAISGQGFIFDPENGNSFTTNSTGLFILNLLKDEKETTDIIQSLADHYGISKAEAAHDLEDFKNLLRQNNLLDKNHD